MFGITLILYQRHEGSLSDSHHVSPENGLALHVLKAKLADVEAAQTCIFLRIGGVVPGVQLVAAKKNGLDHVTALSDLTLDTELLLQEVRQEMICSVSCWS